MIKVIIFDCWGTLFTNGKEAELHLFEVFARKLGHTLKDPLYLKTFESCLMLDVYTDLKMPIKSLLADLKIKATEQLIDELEDILLESVTTQKAYSDTLGILENLKGDYKLLLATNSIGRLFKPLEEKFELRRYFDTIYTSYELHAIKPSPAFFKKIINEANCLPREILMVGDNFDDDIEPARRLGLKTLLVDRRGRYPDLLDKVSDLENIKSRLSEM